MKSLSISLSEINKMNPFLLFLSSLCYIDEVALFANLGKTSLAKGTAKYYSTFSPNLFIILPNVLQRNTPD